MKYIIINADDFGKFKSVNDGIIEGINQNVITSTSLLVYGDYTSDIEKIINNQNISIGLHFEPIGKDVSLFPNEFFKQIELFNKIVGRKPDHIDSHKVRLKELTSMQSIVQKYSDQNKTPLRDWGHANFIDNFFGLSRIDYKTTDVTLVSTKHLIQILESKTKDGYNEIMCHAGWVDQNVINNSSYNTGREAELESLLSSEFKLYLKNNRNIKLISWKEVTI